MGEDDGLQEAGEGVIENNRKQEERTDKCVCVRLKSLCCTTKKKKKIYHPSSPVSLSPKRALSNHLLHPLDCFILASCSHPIRPLSSP